MTRTAIEGGVFRIVIEDESSCGSGQMVTVYIGDGGAWFTKMSFDAMWLEVLRDTIDSACSIMERWKRTK